MGHPKFPTDEDAMMDFFEELSLPFHEMSLEHLILRQFSKRSIPLMWGRVEDHIIQGTKDWHPTFKV